MVIYLSSLIRSVIALHDLVNNKIRYNEEITLDLNLGDKLNLKKGGEAAASSQEEKKEDGKNAKAADTDEKKK